MKLLSLFLLLLELVGEDFAVILCFLVLLLELFKLALKFKSVPNGSL
jgi:hypothetical protein